MRMSTSVKLLFTIPLVTMLVISFIILNIAKKITTPSPVVSHFGPQVEESWTRCDYQGRLVSCEEYRKLVAAEQYLEGDPN